MDDVAIVMACLAAAHEIADESIAKTDQPPLSNDEKAILDVGISAGVAGALRVIEEPLGQMGDARPAVHELHVRTAAIRASRRAAGDLEGMVEDLALALRHAERAIALRT